MDDTSDVLNSPNRRGSVREENRRRTTKRLVAAAAALVRRTGQVNFSMPEVASESGVALRTLYRYFPKRQDLIDALATVADQTAANLPETLDEIEPWLVNAWRNLLEEEALLRAQHIGPAGAQVRRTRAIGHRAITVRLVTAIAPSLPPGEVDDIVDIAMLVCSSTAMFEFLDVMDVSPERGAHLAAKTIRTLVDAAHT